MNDAGPDLCLVSSHRARRLALFGLGRLDPRSGAPSGVRTSCRRMPPWLPSSKSSPPPWKNRARTSRRVCTRSSQYAANAVATYLGLSVLVARSEPAFAFTVLADGVVAEDVRTSLQVIVPGPGERAGRFAVTVTLYARSPGAFVDLAADLAWLTKSPVSDFVLDQHLALPAASATETGDDAGRGVARQSGDWGSHRTRLHPRRRPTAHRCACRARYARIEWRPLSAFWPRPARRTVVRRTLGPGMP